MKIKLNRINSSGDTLIEVLLSVAIVSLILAAAFVATNDSLIAERESLQRSQALQIAESQLETLTYSVNTNPDFLKDISTTSNINMPFCFYTNQLNDTSSTYPAGASGDIPTPPEEFSLFSTTNSLYGGSCYFNANNTPSNVDLVETGIPNTYQVAIINYPYGTAPLTPSTTSDQCFNLASTSNPFNTGADYGKYDPSINTSAQFEILVQWSHPSGTLSDRSEATGICNFLSLVYRIY